MGSKSTVTVDIDKDNTCLTDAVKDISKKVLKALSYSDIYEIYYKLQKINICGNITISDSALLELSKYIRAYKKTTHIFETGFDKFMNNLFIKIHPECIDLHIRCLAYLDNIDIEYYRELFSYSKVFQCFKDKVSMIFVDRNINALEISLLIKLLNSNKLVYKNILPVITKIKLYVENGIVDTNVSACFKIMHAVILNCPEYFNDKLILSLINYVAKVLHTPQNFLFLRKNDILTLIESLKQLSEFKFTDASLKSNAVGLLKECVIKINEYKKSTVHEECIVVINMTAILSYILNICIKLKCDDFDFINPDFLNFNIGRPVDSKNVTIDHKEKPTSIDFYTISNEKNNAHSVLENKRMNNLKNEFLEYKYRFLNILAPYKNCYSRIAFYNNISKTQDPYCILKSMSNLKNNIDWSDLIEYACNSAFKSLYIPFLFDRYFLKKEGHWIYPKIFLKCISDNYKCLIYFTKMAIITKANFIIIDIYLTACTGLKKVPNNPILKKILLMILTYLNKNSKLENSENLEDNVKIIDFLINEFIEKINEYNVGVEVLPLLLTLISEDCTKTSAIKIYGYLGNYANNDMAHNIPCLCMQALILNKNNIKIIDIVKSFQSNNDIIVGLLNYYKSNEANYNFYKTLKIMSFEFLLKSSPIILSEISMIVEKSDKSTYLNQYEALSQIILAKEDVSK